MNEQPLTSVPLSDEEVRVMLEYSAFLKVNGLERQLLCVHCGNPAELGTGETGWKCDCRILVWRQLPC